MNISKLFFYLIILLVLLSCTTKESGVSTAEMPELPTMLQRADIRGEWLKERLGPRLLIMMRKHNIDMWIVVNEEFNPDPVTPYITPPMPIQGRRDIFIFADAGEGLDRIAMIRYEELRLLEHYELAPSGNPAEVLRNIVDKYGPENIGLNMNGRRGHQNGLSAGSYNYLVETLGEEISKLFVSSADLLTDFLAIRLPEELEQYRKVVEVTDILVQRAFSNEVITAGETTVGDIRWWLREQVNNIGLEIWFLPDLRVQRRGRETPMWGTYLRPTPEDLVIERGDVIHVDFGIDYMGMSSDWQKHGYVLHKGENDAPEGLKAAMRNTNLLQDAVFKHARPGVSGGEVYKMALEDMQIAGIEAMIYSHAIGTHGHGLGPGISRGSRIDGDGSALLLNTYMAIELNTSTSIPEWDNKKVAIMMEDDAHLTENGFEFFRPRQTEFYLIK